MARQFDEEAAITALIGDDQRLLNLFREDADFNAGVRFTVRTMALTIDALADEAEKARVMRKVYLEGLITEHEAANEAATSLRRGLHG